MWESIARLVLKFRLFLLVLLLSVTAFMAWHASRVQMSYDFTRTVPTDNAKYVEYESFRKRFGDDGNLLVVGIQTDKLFQQSVFSDYIALGDTLKKIKGVVSVLDAAVAVNLVKNDSTQQLKAVRIFPDPPLSQAAIDSGKAILLGLPFYRGLLYNPETHVWLMVVNVSNEVMNTAGRIVTVGAITQAVEDFGRRQGIEVHISGLPLIRTKMAVKVAHETTWFLLGSVLLMTIILFLFFRSFSTLMLSLAVVIIGVVFSLGTMDLFGYKITLLNALTPTLVVVIGIPNCIYFLNKYHTSYNDTGDKRLALVEMIRRMGIVTLFCNLTAAIGFGVFALTRSAILKEFGVVAGINIMLLFFISFILIPIVLSYLPPPKVRHTRYLTNRWLTAILDKLEVWTTNHRVLVYSITLIVLAGAVAGMFRLKSEGFIVDDLPKKDPIYLDLKFFERHFRGVMPLEIVIDTKRRKGLRLNMLQTLDSVDRLSRYIAAQPDMARPLSLAEAAKFIRQSFYGGDSASYALPNSFDLPLMASYLSMGSQPAGVTTGTSPGGMGAKNGLSQLIKSFVDSNQQQLRISVNMADVGSARLPGLLDSLQKRSAQLFDSSRYKVEFTGTSVTYLEGSSFIIKGLKDSIEWAFVLIAACMLFLFRSVRILLCSLIPNIIPLIITAGIMGWVGVRLKPSTVIVFSIALGIAIDITIRFLVNYKQEMAHRLSIEGEGTDLSGIELPRVDSHAVVVETIHKTGISILYTSMVLIAGFVIFCFSDFGGIEALGWLTSVTLVIATLTNLIFLPSLLMSLMSPRSRRSRS
ncbi:MAG: MMPL family transporter [Bacteroidota bacterium]|nr:MMPL family transporter [Bacteroidota bacterium]MDP4258353.1 MMPL family transporter [Bacteroidota bacterium]